MEFRLHNLWYRSRTVMRRLFRRPLILIVTAWANLTYRRASEVADRRHVKERVMIYVAENPWRRGRLETYDRWQFEAQKSVFGRFATRRLTLQTLKNGCWYHTPDTAGNQALASGERETRRLAFVRDRLKAARLLR